MIEINFKINELQSSLKVETNMPKKSLIMPLGAYPVNSIVAETCSCWHDLDVIIIQVSNCRIHLL